MFEFSLQFCPMSDALQTLAQKRGRRPTNRRNQAPGEATLASPFSITWPVQRRKLKTERNKAA